MKNLATVGGIALAALALFDTVSHWKGSNIDVNPQVTGSSVTAFLMVGIIVGMLTGIGMAFAYFMWKEEKLKDKPDELAQLLEELSRDEALYVDDNAFEGEEKGDTLEPWERPTDWWKSDED